MRPALTAKEEVVDFDELKRRLESEARQLNRTHYAADFYKTQQAAEQLGQHELVAMLNIERQCHLAYINEGQIQHPVNWDAPENEVCSYLLGRYEEAVNPVVKLRYGLVVLLSFKGRHTGKLAKELIYTLLAIVNSWQEQMGDDESETTYHDCATSAFLISQQYKYKAEEVRLALFAPLVAGKLPDSLQHWMLRFFAEQARKLTREACAELDTACVLFHEKSRVKGDNAFSLGMICDAGAALAGRASAQPQEWFARKGDDIKAEGIKRLEKEPESFIVQTLFDDALKEYRRAGDAQRIAEIGALISKTKHLVRMPRVRLDKTIDGDVGKMTTAYMQAVPKMLLAEGGNPFWRMLLSGHVLPSVAASRGRKGMVTDFSQFMRKVNFDINRNVSTRHTGAKAQEGPDLFNYSWSLAFTKAKMRETIRQGILSGQITYDTLVEHLNTETWLGQKTLVDSQAEEEQQYSWVELISPALRYCFAELTKKAEQEEYQPEMMLCMDSLVLKFEQMLRDFCRQVDLPTNELGRDGDMREKYIEDLLDQLGEYADEDSLYMLRFVLTKTGWNLRNNIAHAFLSPSAYNADAMSVVLLVLLIIASLGLRPDKPI
ncbi:DUF4209 domain-containing protein [Hymenobacter psoromatis]|uniref:DUF4209 domain-containing protein n=2 Tax=Pseudomonadati TaxID=3379134 RepID=UPI001CC1BAE3|nr:DUF4209 domain-containing protein [Hymenobacter psoromatis]